MKKTGLLIGLLLWIVYVANAQNGYELDNEAGTSMKPIVYEMNDVIEAFEVDSLEIVHIEFDLLFADRVREVYRTLFEGYTYGIFAYGDYRINQIGVNLYKWSDEKWVWVKSGAVDNESSTTSLLIDIDETNQYKIELTGNNMVEGYTSGHYAVYLFHN
jgi:hypothetical protein